MLVVWTCNLTAGSSSLAVGGESLHFLRYTNERESYTCRKQK